MWSLFIFQPSNDICTNVHMHTRLKRGETLIVGIFKTNERIKISKLLF